MILRRWVDFTAREEAVAGLAMFRAAVGAILLVTLVGAWHHGAVRALWLPVDAGGITPLAAGPRVATLGGPSAALTWGLLGLCLAGSALVTVGYQTRLAALVAGQTLLALLELQPGTGGGHDRLLTNALWLLVLAPSDGSLSLACRLRTGAWTDATPRYACFRYLAILQLGTVYTVTGWQKLGPEWWPWGNLAAVYRSILTPDWARYDLTSVAHVFPLTQAMTVVTMCFECGFPLVVLWLCLRDRYGGLARFDVRTLFLGVGLVLHLSLEATMNLGPFAWATLAWYPCFYTTEEWRAVSARFAALVRR